MIKLFSILVFCFISNFSFGQTWLFSRGTGGSDDDRANCIATDNSGNIFIAGSFNSSSVQFGSLPALTNTVNGFSDIFVAKYDFSGIPIWSVSFGGNLTDDAYGIVTDQNGNIYLTGTFTSDSIRFGNTPYLINQGIGDIFIVKLDPSGNVIWARSAGGNLNDKGSAIATDPNGNIFITGFFTSSSMNFGNTPAIHSNGSSDIFVAMYDSSGNAIWSRSAGGPDCETATGIVCDSLNNVYVTGWYNSQSIQFGNTPVMNNNNFGANNSSDIFIARFDNFGNAAWSKHIGGIYSDVSYGIALFNNSNIFISGYFCSPTIQFGNTPSLTINGNADVFIARYDSLGNALWVRNTGGGNVDYSSGIIRDINGHLDISGFFSSSTIQFGNSQALTNNGNDDIFIATYDTAGNVLLASGAGGTLNDESFGIATDQSGNLFICGSFNSPVLQFGNNPQLTNLQPNFSDIFISKFGIEPSLVKPITVNREILIFPNLTNSGFTIKSKEQGFSYKLINNKGQVVETGKTKDNNATVDLSDISPGMYIVQVFSRGTYFSTKVVKE